MSRIFSEYNSVLTILLFMLCFNSCKNEEEKKVEADFDSLKTKIGENKTNDSINESAEVFDKIISEYSQKHNALSDFSKYSKSNSSDAIKYLKNKYILFPIMKNQIDLINQNASLDTVLTYLGNNSNAFVFNANDGLLKIKGLDKSKNAIVLFKVSLIEVTQKLYLMKRYKDFQHKERKVTEFYITGQIIDAFNVNSPETKLREKFNLE